MMLQMEWHGWRNREWGTRGPGREAFGLTYMGALLLGPLRFHLWKMSGV